MIPKLEAPPQAVTGEGVQNNSDQEHGPGTANGQGIDASWRTPEGARLLERAILVIERHVRTQIREGHDCDLACNKALDSLLCRQAPQDCDIDRYAVRAAQLEVKSAVRKSARRANRSAGQNDAIEDRTIGHDAVRRKRECTYTKVQEPGLREEVAQKCASEYLKTWGHEWDAKQIGATIAERSGLPAPVNRTVLDILREASEPHARHERDARAALDALKEALTTLGRLAASYPRGTDGEPRVGGHAVRLVALFPPADDMLRTIRSQVPKGYLSSDVQMLAMFSALPDFWRDVGITRAPTVDELTTIALLAGYWPDIRDDSWDGGISATKLINRHTRPTIAAALKTYRDWLEAKV